MIDKSKQNLKIIQQAFLEFQNKLAESKLEQRGILTDFVRGLEQEKIASLRKKLQG